jgi:hypothetical protein
MEKFEKEIGSLLHSVGAESIPKRRHEVYRLPDGRNFVQSRTQPRLCRITFSVTAVTNRRILFVSHFVRDRLLFSGRT